MRRGKSTRLPSAALIFEYQGRLYEGRPQSRGVDLAGVETFDEAKITLFDGHAYGLPWAVVSPDEPGLRARTKAARELLAHALAAQDEQIDAEVAKWQAEQDARDHAVDSLRFAVRAAPKQTPVEALRAFGGGVVKFGEQLTVGLDFAAPGSGERSAVVASKQDGVITVHEIVELGEGVERLTIEIEPAHPDGFGGDDFNGPYKIEPAPAVIGLPAPCGHVAPCQYDTNGDGDCGRRVVRT